MFASAVAILGSGRGASVAMFKLSEDLRRMLKSEDFKADIEKRQGAVANMEKPATPLVDAAIAMGAEIVSVDFK